MSNISAEQKANFQAFYPIFVANHEVRQSLGEVVLATVSGPSAIGKTSLMNQSGFNTVYGVTTRPARPYEKGPQTYKFLPDTSEQYDALLQDVRYGKLVQFSIGLEDYFYGSYPDEYVPRDGGRVAITDNNPAGVKIMRWLPFEQTHNVYLTAPFQEWFKRFSVSRAERLNDELRTKARIEEVHQSLSEALEDDAFHFVENRQGELNTAAQKLRAIVLDGDGGTNAARATGEQLRRDIKDSLLA